MKLTDETQTDLATYRDLAAKIFKLVKQCKDSNIPKIDKLRLQQDDLIKANRELDEYLTDQIYRY